MNINLTAAKDAPVLKDAMTIISNTDLEGNITFVNHNYVDVSGFSEKNLVGCSQHTDSHPDIPAEVFADMWATLKAGKTWSGIIKNRAQSGDFYWVKTNATPLFTHAQITGYIFVSKKASTQQVESVESIYQLFKEGKAKGLSIVEGQIVRDSIAYRLKTRLQNLNVSKRLFAMVAFTVLIASLLMANSLYELNHANATLKMVHDNRMLPIEHLYAIEKLRENNIILFNEVLNSASVVNVVSADGKTKEAALAMTAGIATAAADDMENNAERINKQWKSFMANSLTPEEKVLASNYEQALGKFIEGMVKPGILALNSNNYTEAKMIYAQSPPLREDADDAAGALLKLQSNLVTNTYKSAETNFKKVRMISIGVLVFAMALLIWIGLIITRSITKPLKQAIAIFGEISSNKLDNSINVEGNNEMSEVLRALKTTQTMLNVNLNVQHELARKIEIESVKYENQLDAIAKSSGVIEFTMDGKVITANDIFLDAMGYSLDEVVGQQHSIFVASAYSHSDEYVQFWEKLNNGEAVSGEFRVIGKEGEDIWLQASYNPIVDVTGKPYKVVKYATDVTEQKLKNANFEGQIEAIGKSQGVIEIDLDGNILKVNAIYLKMLGYTEQELLGKHVTMVLEPAFAKSASYQALWSKLVHGGTDAGQYKRIAKNGSEVWIQASYNPIYDLDGKPYKVVNYTIDITAQKVQAANFEGQISAIDKIQGVIEFDLIGNITAVNENFANVIGYSEKEIVGNNHSMFFDAEHQSSQEYITFWNKVVGGEADAGQYKRIGKDGKEVWLQGSYNPILDMNGKPFKVVKYTTDITEQYKTAEALQAAVEETQAIIESAKSGDLSSRVPLTGKAGAISALCDGINALMDKMTEVIIQVREAGETINTAADEISSGNTNLSTRTEQQASSLEETASSMEELASTVKQNAENAKQANQLASMASEVAVKGGAVVGQVINTMTAINQSARKIEDIISVINGIAFQTNILALNAAVEAARAGEQGRGFAVVAGEVRNLAQRSASAAKEIKELITDSVNKTTQGTAQVAQAGKTMQEIVTSVQRVTDIMSEITAASVEQSAGIDQVNNAINSMDEVTQQNAALVEQATAAAESLVDQALGLMDTVSSFKLRSDFAPNATYNSTDILARIITESSSVSYISNKMRVTQAHNMLIAGTNKERFNFKADLAF